MTTKTTDAGRHAANAAPVATCHLVTRSGRPWCDHMGTMAGQGVARASGVDQCSFTTSEAALLAVRALASHGMVCEVVPGECPEAPPLEVTTPTGAKEAGAAAQREGQGLTSNPWRGSAANSSGWAMESAWDEGYEAAAGEPLEQISRRQAAALSPVDRAAAALQAAPDPRAMSLDLVRALKLGDMVRVLEPVSGGVTYGDAMSEYQVSAGAGQIGTVTGLDRKLQPLPNQEGFESAGFAVTVTIITGAPGVVNVFDETDKPAYPLELLTPAETAIARQLADGLALVLSRYMDDLNGAGRNCDGRIPTGETFNDFASEVSYSADLMAGRVGPAIDLG